MTERSRRQRTAGARAQSRRARGARSQRQKMRHYRDAQCRHMLGPWHQSCCATHVRLRLRVRARATALLRSCGEAGQHRYPRLPAEALPLRFPSSRFARTLTSANCAVSNSPRNG